MAPRIILPRRRRASPAALPVLLWTLIAVLTATSPTLAREQATPDTGPPAAGDVAALLPTPGPLPEGTAPAGEPLAAVATTGIIADLVRQVGGPRVEVESILPANADPHDFEPAPEDLVTVAEADIIFRHGLRLDGWAEGLLENAGTEAPVVVTTEGISPLASDEDEFAEGDPHVWFDPSRVAMMVATIAGALTDVDPDGAATYQARADAYRAQLTDLDATIRAAIATIPSERRKLVTNHDALGYYADRYGLTIVGTVIPGLETTAEPSAQEIAELLDVIEREGVPAIFAENTASAELAEELADEAGIEIVDDLYTDSLGDPSSGADTYLGLMRTDTILIVEALR